jgi:two-component system LytT family sensor kinase
MGTKTMLKAGIHLIVWLLLVGLIAAFVSASPNDQTSIENIFTPSFAIFVGVYAIIFYGNSEVLFPKLYLRRKYALYFVILALLLIAINYLQPFDHLMHSLEGPRHHSPPPFMREGFEGRPPRGEHKRKVDIVSITLFIMLWSLGSALQIFKQWRDTQQKVANAEAGKANAELSFLKAQINPHFLFNTLNNIYALAVTKNESTAEAVMKLSNIMRYVTDEGKEDFVPLENEVECIRDYIDLQRLRVSKKVDIDFSVEGVLEGKKIAPLILMTFVENVFKYGTSNHEATKLLIKLTRKETLIKLFCQNRLLQGIEKLEREGIGIANTKQRLELLYPGRHNLDISTANDLFTVELTIELQGAS